MISNYTQKINKALLISDIAHQDKADDTGVVPYIYHPIHLAEQMPDEDSIITALLHDVIECSNFTLDNLRFVGFNDNILKALDLLTKYEGESYLDYISKIAESDSELAKRVKIADLQHNLNASRFATLGLESFKSKVERRTAALNILINKGE